MGRVSCVRSLQKRWLDTSRRQRTVSATRAMEAEGVDYPRALRAVQASKVQEVADNWSSIAIPNREPSA